MAMEMIDVFGSQLEKTLNSRIEAANPHLQTSDGQMIKCHS
jgi:hypothetical protein